MFNFKVGYGKGVLQVTQAIDIFLDLINGQDLGAHGTEQQACSSSPAADVDDLHAGKSSRQRLKTIDELGQHFDMSRSHLSAQLERAKIVIVSPAKICRQTPLALRILQSFHLV